MQPPVTVGSTGAQIKITLPDIFEDFGNGSGRSDTTQVLVLFFLQV